MPNKKIIFLTTRLSTGGAELNCLMLAEQFLMRGYDTEMWSLYKAGEIRPSEVPMHVIAEHPPRNPLEFLNLIYRFFMRVRHTHPYAMYGFQPLANIVGAISMLGGGNFIASQRNPASSQRTVIRIIERIIGSTAAYSSNIAVSHAVADSYKNYPKPYVRKLKVIHNGLPLLRKIEESKRDSREKLGLPIDVPMIGAIARLHEQKNPFFLYKVLNILNEYHLVFVGDGPLEAALRRDAKCLSSRVHFAGRLEGDDILRAYNAIDVLVFPSIYEGFGRTLVEAMSLGIPIVANDIPVTREVLGDAGKLSTLEAHAWASLIRDAKKSGENKKGLQRALNFTLDAMVGKYYDELIMK